MTWQVSLGGRKQTRQGGSPVQSRGFPLRLSRHSRMIDYNSGPDVCILDRKSTGRRDPVRRPPRETPMSSVKEAARQIIDNLPDQATWDDLMYEIYVKQKIESGLDDIEAGRTIPHDQVKAELLGHED